MPSLQVLQCPTHTFICPPSVGGHACPTQNPAACPMPSAIDACPTFGFCPTIVFDPGTVQQAGGEGAEAAAAIPPSLTHICPVTVSAPQCVPSLQILQCPTRSRPFCLPSIGGPICPPSVQIQLCPTRTFICPPSVQILQCPSVQIQQCPTRTFICPPSVGGPICPPSIGGHACPSLNPATCPIPSALTACPSVGFCPTIVFDPGTVINPGIDPGVFQQGGHETGGFEAAAPAGAPSITICAQPVTQICPVPATRAFICPPSRPWQICPQPTRTFICPPSSAWQICPVPTHAE